MRVPMRVAQASNKSTPPEKYEPFKGRPQFLKNTDSKISIFWHNIVALKMFGKWILSAGNEPLATSLLQS